MALQAKSVKAEAAHLEKDVFPKAAIGILHSKMTPREKEVMRLLARGYTYKEIAAELFLGLKTIETHASAVLRKLQLSNRRELSRWASGR